MEEKKTRNRDQDKVQVPSNPITDQSLSVREINSINTRMYNNRIKFMDYFDKYGNMNYDEFQLLLTDIGNGAIKVSMNEMAVIRILFDITAHRTEFQDKIANIFSSVLTFMSGDINGEIKYKTSPKDILKSYQDFVKENEKTPQEFAFEFDNWVMFICSDPSLWNDEAFRVVKTIGDWIIKITMHHANSMKHEKLNTLMDRLKDILINRIGNDPHIFGAMLNDIQVLMKEMDLLNMPQIKTIEDLKDA